MLQQITIASRFCGPPDSGNGGYVCGVVANHVDGPAEVTLRIPPPLERPLAVDYRDGIVRLMDGGTLVAEGRAAAVDVEPPVAPTFADAEAAARQPSDFPDHVFPTCFVCGPKRTPGDGLCIYTGLLDGSDVMAAPWIPDPSLANEDGVVRPEFLWSALDCPGGFAIGVIGAPAVLGRLAARLEGTVAPGERCVVIGWPLGVEGRKRYSGTALFGADGGLRGVARATWIAIPPPA